MFWGGGKAGGGCRAQAQPPWLPGCLLFGREFWPGLGRGGGLGAVFPCGVVGSFVFQDGPVGSVGEGAGSQAWAASVLAGCCQTWTKHLLRARGWRSSGVHQRHDPVLSDRHAVLPPPPLQDSRPGLLLGARLTQDSGRGDPGSSVRWFSGSLGDPLKTSSFPAVEKSPSRSVLGRGPDLALEDGWRGMREARQGGPPPAHLLGPCLWALLLGPEAAA
ncbi:uncharacterized protein LOC123625970 [Lemur catta]|uniref:uncharacterized protein LOC123625970 n=1 Tax=Lemur catta TaxID=9447 RepID=UPI001E26830F|nr:uncharacterized protein LOC123625970 [Lemur catta]